MRIAHVLGRTLREGRARGNGVVAVLAVLILGRSALRAIEAGGNRIDLVPGEIALGAIPEGDERVVMLTVSNRGPSAASVVVVPSCTCTVPEAGTVEIGPFSNASFPVRVSTARRPGFNVAQVQIANPSGVTVGRSRITFTTVRSVVIDPPVLFVRGGDGSASANVYVVGRDVPIDLAAVAEDPALSVRAARTGPRSWKLAVEQVGRPRTSLANVRIVDRRSNGDVVVGLVTVSLPASRIGNVRLSPVAEPVDEAHVRAWMLVDTEARCDMRVWSLRSSSGPEPRWTATPGVSENGSHLWLELVYPRKTPLVVIDVEVEVGRLREKVTATLPTAS